MKKPKTPKKLELERKTLKKLDRDALAKVAGGLNSGKFCRPSLGI